MHRIRVLMVAALGVAALTMSGCSSASVPRTTHAAGVPSPLGGAATSPPPTTSAATSPAAAARPPTTATAIAAPWSPPVPSAGPPECRNHDLKVSEISDPAHEGRAAEFLIFTNISGHLCVLQGYPGAELVGPGGHPLLDARRTLDGFVDANVIGASDPGITAPPQVRLTPGAKALATLEWVLGAADGGTAPGCQVQDSAALLVTPPDSTESTTFPGLSGVCATFVIGPVLVDTSAG